MSEEQQLERSVLERKEREELHAIAEAMELKPGSRTKKSDIIDKILQATGVEAASGGSDGSARRSSDGSASANGAASGLVTSDAGGGAAPATTRDHRSGAPVTTRSAGSPGAGGSAEASTGPEAGRGPAGPNRTPDATADGSGALGAEGQPPSATVPAAPGTTPAEEAPGVEHSAPTGPGGGQPGQRGGQSGQRLDTVAEPGNRRSRRRRGRDRGDRGDRGERELQGAGQEPQYQGEPIPITGLLDLRDEGFGFIRANGYLPSSRDVYVSMSQVRRFALRRGDYIEGTSRPAGSSEKYPALLRIDTVSGMTPDEARQRPMFEDLTPLFPDARLNLEIPGDSANMTARITDLLSPIGKGQRGLIVSPAKAGKTTVLKQIAHSIEANNQEVHLMVLLVSERPEEVTDMRRSVNGEVVASTFDRPSEEHTAVAELAIERAKRLVESKKDVVIILDGITRLARAYNLGQPATGRIMSGGVDSGALYPPKKFFGSARNIEEGGSLTILATALVETGSRMDEVIFEEFKGTGNLELRLDRRLAERRIYPAIDVNASSTRHEELLFDRSQLQQVWKLRRVLNALGNEGNSAAGLELLMDKIKTTKSNEEFLAEIAKGPGA